MNAVRSRRRPVRTATERHRQWLQLVETDGPFLSIPVLKRVYPQGIAPLDGRVLGELKEAKTPFEQAWDAFDREGEPQLDTYRAARDAWVDVVLRRVFGWAQHYVTDAPVEVRSPNGRVTAASTGAFHRAGATAALIWVIDPVRSLHDLLDDGWATSAIDRMELMLRAAGVCVGVVTDGRWWAIVSAPPKTMVASGIVDSQTWVEESDTRDAFAALLSPIRLAGGTATDRLPAMFRDSVAAAEEITESLGSQVRRAIELIVQSFSESAEDAGRRGEPNPLPDDGDQIYSAAVTVMMRVVFLLFAEERDLLPQGQLFDQGYGLTGQLEELRRRAEAESPEALDATSAVWHRLLATSRALFYGATFEDMRLPAYGGSLFDPTRFPFLSSRTDRGPLALAVNDRVMMQVLDAVQMADIKGQGRRPISFRDIDVEQIGYIYEGLLGYTCAFATETIIGLIGKAGSEPEIPLAVLNDLADQHVDDKPIAAAILAWVKEHQPSAVPTTSSALSKALKASDTMEDADLAIRAVTHDADLAAELKGWIGIVRRDLRNRPTVITQGGLLVIETPSRKNAGAHYTPRSLAEEVVLHALEPLVYSPGPYQTPNREEWRLKSPEEILDLKVADIACGSGAFLVAAARYLAARLVEAWAATGTGIGTPKQQETDALRKVVAQCLYGADINPMAIEMCKLSLWLVSLDPKQPFSFVDDKMLVGNSLLGITDLAQIRALHINGKVTSTETLFDIDTDGPIRRAIQIRRALASEIDNDDPQRSARRKQQQLHDLHEVTGELRTWADAVIAAGLRVGGKPGKALDAAYANL
ncbi:MAG: DNA methyltransferase, partial [Propionicimonas sp.]|nr:DNA methyltransferase [Propionicimonas sp.]